MAKSLFTFNFNRENIFKFWLLNRSFLIAFLFFCCLQFICRRIADITLEGSKAVVREKRTWCRGKDTIKTDNHKKQVFFLGDSEILAGLIPEVFDQENNHTTYSYNLALPALPLAPHYFMLKEYLEKNPSPHYILMKLRIGGFKENLFPVYSIQSAKFSEILMYFFLRKDMEILSAYFIPSRLYRRELEVYFGGKILHLLPERIGRLMVNSYIRQLRSRETYPHNWERVFELQYVYPEKFKKEMKEKLRQDRGYYYLFEQAITGEKFSADYNHQTVNNKKMKVIDIQMDPFVDKFFKLTQQHDIKVILMAGYKIKSLEEEENIEEEVTRKLYYELKNRYENIYVHDNGWKIKYYPHHFFSDPVHFNPKGAKEYTKSIAQDFKELVSVLKLS